MEPASRGGTRKPLKTYIRTAVVGIALTLVLFSPIYGYIGIVYAKEQSAPLAKPPYVHWNGLLPQSQVYISWESDQNQSSYVAYGTSQENLQFNVADATLVGMHTMLLTGLDPDTQYYYRVGNASGQWASEVRTFWTAPQPGSGKDFSFCITSDTQQMWGTGHYAAIVSTINSYTDNAFLVDAGDVGEYTNDQHDWNNYWAETAPLTDHIPIVPDPGNHDVGDHSDNSWEDNMYTKYFGISYSTPTLSGHFYSFNYSNCQFVMAEIAAVGDVDPNTPFNQQQDQWINATLQAGQLQDFRILVFHRAPYSSNGNDQTLIDRIMPIVETYNVSLVFYGHQHIYDRYYIANRTLICLGGGGGLQNAFIIPQAGQQITAMGPSFTKVYVNSTAILLKTYTPTFELIDQVILNKIGSNVLPDVVI
ncbi:MAG TPA: metallophosphoesterase family protein [Candidatus Lokiarchaeia archaeon]|nr:metallophosphoesterase family protein [Candidatus Lokiarchaeia archaeon]